MTTPTERDKLTLSSSSQDGPPQKVALLGLSGIVVGVGGCLTVMLLSKHSGWWSIPYILALVVSGIVAVSLGILTIIRSKRIQKFKALSVTLAVLSIVVGSLILATVSVLLFLLLMLSSYHSV